MSTNNVFSIKCVFVVSMVKQQNCATGDTFYFYTVELEKVCTFLCSSFENFISTLCQILKIFVTLIKTRYAFCTFFIFFSLKSLFSVFVKIHSLFYFLRTNIQKLIKSIDNTLKMDKYGKWSESSLHM